ncbi:hypothetical protein CsSME_00022755 [Camellia sinensis var. sinensis]
MMKSTPVLLCSSTSTDHKQIPLLGFGTTVYPFVSSETMKQSILQAIKFGYRHFDSAALYRSEQPLGEAIADAIRLGFIQSRQDLFITSKLWCSDAHRDHVLPAIQKSLKNLGLEYLDLYLVHWPVSSKPGKYELPVNKQELLPLDFKSVWEAMEECQSLGLTKSIGVTYSPLGAKGTLWGSNQVMECEVLKQIAKARGKSVAQVCLRWVYEQGVSVLVKSFNEERIKENHHIFDWELSAQDSEMINQIPQRKGFPGVEFISDVGPYKSLQDLWDGEIA